MKLTVSEIFCSIQGESLFSGCPCIFIRLSGCNLRCTYCDTRYAYGHGQVMDLKMLTDHIARYPYRLIELTGGEPLYQKETPAFIAHLLREGYQVLVETNGSIDIRCIPAQCVRIMDIKCPGSGEKEKNHWDNLGHLNHHDQLKFVIGDREDYLFAKEIIAHAKIPVPPHNILFSPITGSLDPATLAHWILRDGLNIRFQLQLHKIIWPDIERGV